jgi:hypothetical protein
VSGFRPEGLGVCVIVVSELDFVCIFQAEGAKRKNTLIHIKVVSEAACRDRQRKAECWELCGDCCRYAAVKETVRRTVGRGWKHSGLQSDNSIFSRRADR